MAAGKARKKGRGRRPLVHQGVELRCGTRFEDEARNEGFSLPARVDEVGRGASCGPMVAGAVILARDGMMRECDARHPGYGLARNMGYGGVLHREALRRLGPTPIHRRSFQGTERWLF